ncbi:MAG TPA: hypothetical protein VGJ66_18895 [Pyrinomonadaceae bacterium]|jgi:hypothetical protein
MSRASLKSFRLCVTIGAAILILLFAVPLVAQQAPGPPGTPANDPNDPVNQDRLNKADMRAREFLMGNTRKPIRRATWGPKEATLPQITEDFRKIQLVNKELITAVFANNILDPKQIIKATSDIEKRANRLIGNLAFPKPDKLKELPQEKSDLRLLLAKLDSSIMNFVNNPIFQTDRKVVNAELATKVSTDLMTVVKLTGYIRRQAEALGKAQTRP